jgi:hypothetical protein
MTRSPLRARTAYAAALIVFGCSVLRAQTTPCYFTAAGPLTLEIGGAAGTFSVGASGVAGPLAVDWLFSDGTRASGTTVSHAFAAGSDGERAFAQFTVTSGGCQSNALAAAFPSVFAAAFPVTLSSRPVPPPSLCPPQISASGSGEALAASAFSADVGCPTAVNLWTFTNPLAEDLHDTVSGSSVSYAYTAPGIQFWQYTGLGNPAAANLLASAFGAIRISGACPPGPIALAAPAVGQARLPFGVTWNTSSAAGNYEPELATDPAFENLVQARMLGPRRSASVFLADQPGKYYARVVGTSKTCSAPTASNVATVEIAPAPPRVVLVRATSGMIETANQGGATDDFVLWNVGGQSTTVAISTGDTFYQIASADLSFALDAGGFHRVRLTGQPEPAGAYTGQVSAAGDGVAPNFAVPVALYSIPAPAGAISVEAISHRIDVAGPIGANPTGGVTFRNTGSAPATGLVKSDNRWLNLDSPLLTISAGGTATASFSIDRSSRTIGAAALGADSTAVRLILPKGLSAPGATAGSVGLLGGTTGSVTKVSVNDSVVPPASSEPAIPPIPAGQVAFFMPGMGHVQGSVGLFISDAYLADVTGSAPISDLTLYYDPSTVVAGSASARFSEAIRQDTVTKESARLVLPPSQSVAMTDLVATLFGQTSGTGSVQVRTADWDKLGLAASVADVSAAQGTYGTALPVARSDRGVGTGQVVNLVDLRQGNGFHTNLYLQEVSGQSTAVETDFYAADGSRIGSRSDALAPFELKQLLGAVPAGAAGARAINVGTGTPNGAFFAYATPVDEATGDSWAVADWGALRGTTPGVTLLVPVAGVTHGAAGSFFHTDIALSNAGKTASSGTLRYVDSAGPTEEPVDLAPGQTLVIRDAVATFFVRTGDTVGFVEYVPSAGSATITSRTYTTLSGEPGTFGTGAPTLGEDEGLSPADVQRFIGIEDASAATITAGTPGTYRSNLGLVNIGNDAATVSLTLLDASGSHLGSASVTVPPRQLLLSSGIGRTVLGASRDADYGDLHNLQLLVQVTGGTGPVFPFISILDNGTNDSVLRVE